MLQTQLIVGLGNPGTQHYRTRHNAGADLVHRLAERTDSVLKPSVRMKGLVAQWRFADQKCWLLIPSTYMNLSGEAVQAILSYYRLPVEAMLVVHDELDLPVGVVRLKRRGRVGSHNGLRSIVDSLSGRYNFPRLRLGVGHPRGMQTSKHEDVIHYLLSRAPIEEQQLIDTAIDATLAECEDILAGQWDAVMRKLHARSAPELATRKAQ